MTFYTSDIIREKLSTIQRFFYPRITFPIECIKSKSFQGSMLGTYSLYNPHTRRGYCKRIPNWIDKPISPSAIARAVWIKALKAEGLKRVNVHPLEKNNHLYSHPLFCEPYRGEAIYLDLKSAHYSIYKRLPIVLLYTPSRFNFGGNLIGDYLPLDWYKYKLARNSFAGLFRTNQFAKIKDFKVQIIRNTPPTFAPSHWAVIQLTLHWIASKAMQCGATYVYTDGYIFPQSANYEVFQAWVKELGYTLTQKAQGHCIINAVGDYNFIDVKTKLDRQPTSCNNVIQSDAIAHFWKKVNKRYGDRETWL